MSSLPLISHHLFVSAIGSEENPPAEPARDKQHAIDPASGASAIGLELLDCTTSIPESMTRPLRASLSAGAS